jgi:signal transduction histidine kinase
VNRVVLAAIVLLLAVAGLLAAWWISSQRALDAERRLQSQMSLRASLQDERTVADRLGARLEELRRTESLRPYFHYQNLYHDPKGASEGLSVVPSPLANGPANPLIVTHFQIDARDRVSLPTLNDELVELNGANVGEQRTIRDRLAGSAREIRGAAAPLVARIGREAAQARAAATRIAELEAQLAEARRRPEPVKVASEPVKSASKAASNVLILDPSVFAQNVNSNDVYRQLKEPTPRRVIVPPIPTPSPPLPVEIRLSDLEWHTVPFEGTPTLMALRAVHTPEGMLVQGVVTTVAKGAVVDGAVIGTEGTPIEGTGWRALLPPQSAAATAGERERFTRTFTAVAGVLLAVVLGVIWTLSRLQRLATDRARFAATAAHELRTPLASLRLYSDLIADEQDAGKREGYAREIAGQTERLGRVVANVLEVTRLERGTFTLKPREGEIGRVVEECIVRLRPQMEAAHCRIDLEVSGDLPRIAFDADAMHHVVDNLVDNAEKFSRESPNRSITVAVIPEEGGVAITVSDRGPGVPEDLLRDPHPFRRAASSSSTAGLGLGLFLVDRIVRGHGGALRSERREGGGATVRVFLPQT